MRMSQSTDEAEGLERREPKCTRLSLAFPAYIYRPATILARSLAKTA